MILPVWQVPFLQRVGVTVAATSPLRPDIYGVLNKNHPGGVWEHSKPRLPPGGPGALGIYGLASRHEGAHEEIQKSVGACRRSRGRPLRPPPCLGATDGDLNQGWLT